ncbi:hypothetical protein [Alkaliphilus peptidifermentans]|uniref:Uncharacterized protein n=1 Tax=Alkaliphilus peptidifermentans DSM 18978 TaxID=1120976 RepID=A0A1G5FL04_9FIRM|nr:hypothetical protein [Alkaliphilus peptidifermentans]SCY39946.1 hypothetical protein SAMN03080606_01455 [Alkaliphilus peptidifermentans DSM 18978]
MRIEKLNTPITSTENVREKRSKDSINNKSNENEILSSEKKVTYENPKKTKEHDIILKLKAESEANHKQLLRLVRELLQRQGYKAIEMSELQDDDIQVDDTARNEAAALIAEDGPLGAEKTSDRIVAFAKAISGGDKDKLEKLKNAIIEGFKQAEDMLGYLPEVSKETYRLVMEKLDNWANEE